MRYRAQRQRFTQHDMTLGDPRSRLLLELFSGTSFDFISEHCMQHL